MSDVVIENDAVVISLARYNKNDFIKFIGEVNALSVQGEVDYHNPVSEWAKIHYRVGSSGAYGLERMWENIEPIYVVNRLRFSISQFLGYRQFLNEIQIDAPPIVGETRWFGFYGKVLRVDEKFITDWRSRNGRNIVE